MKHIKTIQTLVRRSRRSPRKYAACYRFGHPVYEVSWDEDICTLKHYGTVTVRYNTANSQLLEWYGEGVSDRDSMNTFLHWMGDTEYKFRYGPRMGFVLEDSRGERYETNT